MAEDIQSSLDGAAELAASIQKSLASYLNFTLHELSSDVPVDASKIHDGMSGALARALAAYSNLIVSDAEALLATSEALDAHDKAIASQLLGVGG